MPGMNVVAPHYFDFVDQGIPDPSKKYAVYRAIMRTCSRPTLLFFTTPYEDLDAVTHLKVLAKSFLRFGVPRGSPRADLLLESAVHATLDARSIPPFRPPQ